MVENRSVIDWTEITTVFVDLDDTIWDFTANSAIALKEVMQSTDIGLSDEEYLKFKDIYHIKNNELWELYHYGKIEKDYLINERFRYSLSAIKYKSNDLNSLAIKLNDKYLKTLSLLPNAVSGADELLSYLSLKYKVGVLSNGFKGVQAQKLKSSNLDKYIDLLVLSDEVGVTKPLRGIFDYALKIRNALAKNTVMIGDNYDADIKGAYNAGWKTIFFNKKGIDITDDIANCTVTSLIEIKDIL